MHGLLHHFKDLSQEQITLDATNLSLGPTKESVFNIRLESVRMPMQMSLS